MHVQFFPRGRRFTYPYRQDKSVKSKSKFWSKYDLFKLAGIVGIDPRPFTLAELVAMHDERQAAEYDRTAAIVATCHNMFNAIYGRKGRTRKTVSARNFNPYEQSELDNRHDPTYTGGYATREEYDAVKEQAFMNIMDTWSKGEQS